jgi:hypothetical protein
MTDKPYITGRDQIAIDGMTGEEIPVARLPLSAHAYIDDVKVTLSVERSISIDPEHAASVQKWLNEVVGLVADQTRLGLESKMDAAIARAFRFKGNLSNVPKSKP